MIQFILLLLMVFHTQAEFNYWGWDGCSSTPVPREQVDKVGEAFYSWKIDVNSGIYVTQEEDQEYAIFPNNRHLYGWYYRKVDALNQLDVGVIDISISGADVEVPGTTFNFFGIENMMAIHQENLWSEEDMEAGLKDQEEVLKEFGDAPYDYEKENDFQRLTEVLNHTLGVVIPFQFLMSLYDIVQVTEVTYSKGEVPENSERREFLKQFITDDVGNSGDYNKTSTNCLHIALPAHTGCEIGKDFTKVALNRKFIALKGETVFAPANILQGVVAEAYFSVNQATNALELNLQYFAALQTDFDDSPLTATFYQGPPHTHVDWRKNLITENDIHPYCELIEKYKDKKVDKRMMWSKRDETCPVWLDEEYAQAELPIWQMSGDPADKPQGEDWNYMINYMAKYLPCSIDYMQGWMHHAGGVRLLDATVWAHFTLEVPKWRAYQAAADQMWSHFERVGYIYGNQEENENIVLGQFRGWEYCNEGSQCGDGEGNCEDSNGCKPGLYCHSRTKGHEYVKGYDLQTLDPEVNVCVMGEPEIIVSRRKFWKGCSKRNPCKDGEGDCDDDSDCAEGLQCFERSSGEHVTGYDVESVGKRFDFCVPAKECEIFPTKNQERCACDNEGKLEICGVEEYCSDVGGCIPAPPECKVESWMNNKVCICGVDQTCEVGDGCIDGQCVSSTSALLEPYYMDLGFTPPELILPGVEGEKCTRNVAHINGEVFDTMTVSSANDCLLECNKHDECIVWDWEKNTETCTLRSTKEETDVPEIAWGYIFGEHGGECEGSEEMQEAVADWWSSDEESEEHEERTATKTDMEEAVADYRYSSDEEEHRTATKTEMEEALADYRYSSDEEENKLAKTIEIPQNAWTHYTDLYSDDNCETLIKEQMPTHANLGGCGPNGASSPVIYECWDPKMDDEHMQIIETPFVDEYCTIQAEEGLGKLKMLWTRGECFSMPKGVTPGAGSFIVNWEGKTPCPESWANAGLVAKLCKILPCNEELLGTGAGTGSGSGTVFGVAGVLTLFCLGCYFCGVRKTKHDYKLLENEEEV